MITCLIIDDEPFARDELAAQLAEADDIEIVGQCSNAIEAMQAISRLKPQRSPHFYCSDNAEDAFV